MTGLPYIPETIRVHLGPPGSQAEVVSVSFPDYIKNVASSEIYPTWPENALRANIYAIISYALNRVYTEWYPSMGYDFDITNSTAYDMSFVNGRNIFEDISRIVDEIFNDYIKRQGNIEPLFAAFCDGVEVSCDGLSQWGTVDLAESGLVPYEILTTYYGPDIDIVEDAPIQNITESYPGTPLSLGSSNREVQKIQLSLNRIAKDYPLIPKIPEPDGYFGIATEDAVRAFQRIFNLAEDGIVGKATWYKIQYIFTAVTRLANLNSEGLTIEGLPRQLSGLSREGDSGGLVRSLQYYLSTVAFYNNAIPQVEIDGYFGPATRSSVMGFQKEYGLSPTGVVNLETWEKLVDVYSGILAQNPPDYLNEPYAPFPGTALRLGSQSDAVRLVQERLNIISDYYPAVPKVDVTGYFGRDTQNAVLAFEREFGIPPRGIVFPFTWERLAQVARSVQNAERAEGQYPGYVLRV